MKSDGKPKKILIVDDEKPMAQVLELKLNKVGFKAQAVFDGAEAIKLLGQEKFDLILTDLIMPKVDGFGVLQYIKDKKNKIPVIILSNLGQEEDLSRAMSLGANDYFIKSDTPITKVVDHINKLLDK